MGSQAERQPADCIGNLYCGADDGHLSDYPRSDEGDAGQAVLDPDVLCLDNTCRSNEHYYDSD
ncbi:hypothetical protein D3C80_1744160 [compost metagenome]